MRKTVLRALAGVTLLALLIAGSAYAIRLQEGNLIVVGEGGFSPTTLPKHRFAPIELHGYGKIETVDGSPPPVLKQLTLWFDKHGAVETRGLEVCPKRKLLATTPAQARRNCKGAIVGEGFGKAVVNFPEQKPIIANSPITLFNAPPVHGNPAVFAHGYTTVGGPATVIIPVEIQKVHDGRYGFKTVAEIPKLVNGYGTPIYGRLRIGRKWQYKGRTLSYANASCPDGHLQAKFQSRFADGTFLQGTIAKTCKGR